MELKILGFRIFDGRPLEERERERAESLVRVTARNYIESRISEILDEAKISDADIDRIIATGDSMERAYDVVKPLALKMIDESLSEILSRIRNDDIDES